MNTASTTLSTSFAAAALPAAPAFPAQPAVIAPATRRSLVRLVRHNFSLFATLTLLGSSAAYCVYALGSIAQ